MSPFTLTIDVSDRTAVAAAIPLLQLIISHNFGVQDNGGIVIDNRLAATPAAPAANAQEPNPAIFAQSPAVLPAGAETPMSPAIFGNGAPPLQAFAPPGAGAIQQPNVPGVLPGSFVPPMPGVLPSAQLPGLPAGAPSANATPTGTPAAGPATAGPAVELDAEGIPWDERIHQVTKGKTTKNLWKVKKGFNNDTLLAQIKDELKARVAAGGATAAPAAAVQPQGGPAALPPLGAGPFVPPAAFSPPAPAAAPSAPVGPPTTFDQFMAKMSAACTANILPMEAVQAAVTAYQLPSITALQTNVTYIPHVFQYLQQQYPALV